MCIYEEGRRGRKNREGQQCTLETRCSEAAPIIQSMQLTRHSMCRTAGRRFPPSRKVTLRKRTGDCVIVDCVVIVVKKRGREESEEDGDTITEVQGAECSGILSFLVKRFSMRKPTQWAYVLRFHYSFSQSKGDISKISTRCNWICRCKTPNEGVKTFYQYSRSFSLPKYTVLK